MQLPKYHNKVQAFQTHGPIVRITRFQRLKTS
jgi:hypothetical protein